MAAGRGELDTGGADVVREHVAELVVGHLADERDLPAERGQTGGGVGGRPPRGLDPGAHVGVEQAGRVLVHQLHRALDHAVASEEVVVGAGEHVDDRVADHHDVEGIGPGRRRSWARC